MPYPRVFSGGKDHQADRQELLSFKSGSCQLIG